jgi:hypothetical protein
VCLLCRLFLVQQNFDTVLGFRPRNTGVHFFLPKRNTNFITNTSSNNTIENNIRKRKMSATLIQSLLKDDKSKVATLIAAGASACALIYYNQEIRNQIANIFMVRLFYLLFLLPFSSLFLSLSGVLRVKRSIFSRIGPHPRAIFSISQIDSTRGGGRERER